MAKDGEIALKMVNNQITNKKEFSFKELQSDILSAGGSLRISPCFSVGEYILELEMDGIIQFNSVKGKFEIK